MSEKKERTDKPKIDHLVTHLREDFLTTADAAEQELDSPREGQEVQMGSRIPRWLPYFLTILVILSSLAIIIVARQVDGPDMAQNSDLYKDLQTELAPAAPTRTPYPTPAFTGEYALPPLEDYGPAPTPAFSLPPTPTFIPFEE